MFESLPRTNRAGQPTRADPGVLAEIFRTRCKELCEQVGRESCLNRTVELMDTYISAKRVLRTVSDLQWATKRLRLKRGIAVLERARSQMGIDAQNKIDSACEAMQRHLKAGHDDVDDALSAQGAGVKVLQRHARDPDDDMINYVDVVCEREAFFIPFPDQIVDLIDIAKGESEDFEHFSQVLREVGAA